MNGDGFGVGWYHTNVATCPYEESVHPFHTKGFHGSDEHKGSSQTLAAVFKDTQPAWNNANLREICMATRSDCIIAHVRAASKNTGVSQANCHPFKAGRLLFCHNGRIDNFSLIRRAMMAHLSDEAYVAVRGTTDSECIFAMILTYLARDDSGEPSPFVQTTTFGHSRIAAAIKKTLRTIEIMLHEHGLTEGYCTFNFSCTDGESVVVTRFCDKSPDIPPPSLYFAYGNAQRLYSELTSEDPVSFVSQQSSSDDSSLDKADSDNGSDTDSETTYNEKPVLLDKLESRPGRLFPDVDAQTACFIVASNPLTRTHTWHPMPRNSIMWCTRGSPPELRLLRLRSRTASMLRTHLPTKGDLGFSIVSTPPTLKDLEFMNLTESDIVGQAA
jgi:predicted glutamine amidotransferase